MTDSTWPVPVLSKIFSILPFRENVRLIMLIMSIRFCLHVHNEVLTCFRNLRHYFGAILVILVLHYHSSFYLYQIVLGSTLLFITHSNSNGLASYHYIRIYLQVGI